MVIDNKMNGRIILGDEVIAEKMNMHDDFILCVGVQNKDRFATGDKLGICKIWSNQFEN